MADTSQYFQLAGFWAVQEHSVFPLQKSKIFFLGSLFNILF